VKRIAPLLVAGMIAAAGCGGGDEEPADKAPAQTPAETPAETAPAEKTGGIKITLSGSDFGSMLFDSRKQAIYVFEKDREGESVCYGDCAEAWPPVLTTGKPVAAKGVDRSLLGTAERRDGKLQVTYAGKPLYFYAHEGPGEVKCHNVRLNGGYWWVVGPSGERRA